MPTELAAAYITLIPSLQGAESKIQSQLSGIDTTSAGKKVGGSMTSGIASGLQQGLGAVTAAIGGLAISGGISRALSIEAAETKLAGLGHTAEDVSAIMADALASVKGTAYGLGDAATVAAQMAAVGISSGEDMQHVLKAVADTAQISGRSMTDVGNIFGSVAARGKLQGDDMLQLTSSGIPVLQLLADHLGTTSEAVSKMVTAGQIDFQTFADAMEEGMGGAALNAGETFTGALANVKASLSRLGEKFATPVLGGMRQLFVALIPVIDAFTSALSPLADALSDKLAAVLPPIVERLTEFGESVSDMLSGDGLGDMAQIAGVAGGALLALSSGGIAQLLARVPMLGTMFGGMGGALSALGGPIGIAAAALAGLVATSPGLRDALGGALSQVAAAMQQLFAAVAPVVQQIAEALMPLFPMLADALAVVVTVLGEVVAAVIPLVAQVVEAVGPPLTNIASAVVAAFQYLGEAVTAVLAALAPLAEPLLGLLQGVVDAFCAVLQGDWGAAWDAVKGILSGALSVIGDAMSAAMTALGDTVSSGVDSVLGFFGDLGQGIVDAFADAGSWLIDAGSNIMSGLLEGITAGFSAVGDFICGLGPWIANNKGPKAYDLALLVPNGGWIMQSLATGLRKGMPSVKSALKDVTDGIQSFATAPSVGLSASVAYSAAGSGAYTARADGASAASRLDAILDLMESDSFGSVYIDGKKAGSVLAKHVDSSLGAITTRRGAGL